MEDLEAFVFSNIYSACSEEEGDRGDNTFRSGLVGLDVLERILPENDVEECRIKYVRNLCLTDPAPFLVPENVSALERACMRFSFHEYGDVDLSMYDFRHELVGCLPTSGGTLRSPVLVVKCKNTRNDEMHVYTTKDHVFGNVMVGGLTAEEQAILLIEMIRAFKTEIFFDLKILKVKAYIDRLLFRENEKNEIIRRIVLYYYMMTTMDCQFVELKQMYEDVTISVFETPFVFLNEIEKQMAEIYYACSSHREALKYFEKYNDGFGQARCLAKLSRKNEAVSMAVKEIQRIGTRTDFRSRVRICNMNIFLGEITGEEAYFDAAFRVYRSYEPFRAKGIHFFKAGNFKKAVVAFKDALELAPQSTELLSLYASTLVSLEMFEEAEPIYKKLVKSDEKDVRSLKNLAMCRIQLRNVEAGLKDLKEASKHDQNAMQVYFLICVKHKIRDGVIYALERVRYFEDLEKCIVCIVEDEILEKDELRDALGKNGRIYKELDFLLKKIDETEHIVSRAF